MSLLNHIGVLLLFIIVANIIEILKGGFKDTDWWVPSLAGIAIFLVFEVLYWLIYFFFITN